MTRTVSNCQYDIGVKGQGQNYSEFAMAGNTTSPFILMTSSFILMEGVHIWHNDREPRRHIFSRQGPYIVANSVLMAGLMATNVSDSQYDFSVEEQCQIYLKFVWRVFIFGTLVAYDM